MHAGMDIVRLLSHRQFMHCVCETRPGAVSPSEPPEKSIGDERVPRYDLLCWWAFMSHYACKKAVDNFNVAVWYRRNGTKGLA
jgi:hypothetical protein